MTPTDQEAVTAIAAALALQSQVNQAFLDRLRTQEQIVNALVETVTGLAENVACIANNAKDLCEYIANDPSR